MKSSLGYNKCEELQQTSGESHASYLSSAEANHLDDKLLSSVKVSHAKQQTSQQYSSNYSPEVETEKPFKRKRKENDLDGKVLCVF